jgi:hypothetical protein
MPGSGGDGKGRVKGEWGECEGFLSIYPFLFFYKWQMAFVRHGIYIVVETLFRQVYSIIESTFSGRDIKIQSPLHFEYWSSAFSRPNTRMQLNMIYNPYTSLAQICFSLHLTTCTPRNV